MFDRPVIETCVRVRVCVFVCILKVVGPRFLLLGRPVVETSAFCQLRCYVFRWRKIKGLQGTINYHIMGGNQNTYLISNTYMILFFFSLSSHELLHLIFWAVLFVPLFIFCFCYTSADSTADKVRAIVSKKTSTPSGHSPNASLDSLTRADLPDRRLHVA